MADLTNSPVPPTDPFNADVYWRYASEGDEQLRLLGTFGIGTPQSALIPVPTTADVVLKALPRGPRGTYQHPLAAEGPSTTINIPGIGGAGPGASFYQTLKQNNGYQPPTSVTLPQEAVINFLNAFQLKDDPAHGETDLSTFGVPTGMFNLKTDFNASGQIKVTTGTIASGSLTTLTCAATLELQPGMGIYIAGAASPNALITKVTAVSTDGLTYTLQDAATVPVSSATVQGDDTAAVQAWINAKGDLTMPPGYYRLTSSIVIPPATEGFSLVIHGSGWDQSQFAFQHTGDGFVVDQTATNLRFDSLVFKDLNIATGTIGDDQGTVNANNRGHGLRLTAPSIYGIYDQLVLQRCRIIGWGRFGIWTDNLEVSWIDQCIFRLNSSGHIAFIAPDEIGPNKQPNANVITASTCDSAFSNQTTKLTTTGSMASGSNVLTIASGSLTANDRGRAVIVHGGGVGGAEIYSFIDVVTSATQVQLAYQAQSAASGVSVEILPVNVASVFLNRANDTVIQGMTIQNNWYKDNTGTNINTPISNDVNAIRADQCFNLRITGVHEEDPAGWGGAAVRLASCKGVTIENWGGTSGDAALQNAHGQDFRLIDTQGVRVSQCYFNDRPQFVIDDLSSGIEIDNSWVVGFNNLWQSDSSWEKLKIGTGVRTQQSANQLTNQSCGNEYLYDSLFGRDLITNGRFLDGTSPAGLEGWTTTNPTWWTRAATSDTRYGTYINIDSTSIADGGPQTLLHQTVPIPDSLPSGGFTLGFDWQIVNESGSSAVSGRYTEIRLHPSSGIDEAMQWVVRGYSYVIGVWQSAQIKCWLGSGTGRTIDVQINATSGVNNVRMRFANFRLAPGKHIFGSWERAVHDFGGRMRVPLEFNAISSTTYPPPPAGSNLVTLANIGGVLNVGSGGAYGPLAGGSGTGGGANQTLSNLTPPTAINASLLFDTDAAYDVGSVSKRVHNIYALGNLWNYAVGATTSSPRVVGVIPTAIEGSTPGEAGQIAIFGGRDSLQSADGYRTQLSSYWGVEIRGNREVNGGPTFTAGTASDPAVTILAERDVVPLRINSTISLTADLAQFWNTGILPKARIANDGVIYCAGLQATGPFITTITSGTSSVRLDPTSGKVMMTAAQLGTGTTPQCNIYPAVVTASEFGILKCDLTNGIGGQIPTGVGAAANDTFLWSITEGRWKTGPAGAGSITASGTQYFIPRVNPASPYTLVDSGLKDDGVNITCSRPHFFGSPNATVNLGDSSTGQLGAVYVVNGFFINPTGTTRSGPKTIGCIDAFTGTPGGDESGQFLFYYGRSKIQAGNQIRSIWQSYQAIEVRGNRQNTADATLTTGAAGDACLFVISERSTAVPLRIDSTLGLGADLVQFYNNATLKAQINSNGTFLGFAVNVTGANQVSSFNNSTGSSTGIRLDHASGGVWMTGAQKPSTTYPQVNLFADVVTASEWGVLKAAVTNLGTVQIPTGIGSAANDVFLWSTTQGRWIVGAVPGGTGGGANTALSNLTATSINQSFVFNADGVYNIGDGTNRVGAIYLKNAFFVYTVGSSSGSPKTAGFLDPAPGEYSRLLLSGNQSVAQGGNNQRTQITAYHAIELRGNRRSTTPPAFGNVAGTDIAGVIVLQEATDSTPLWVDSTFTLSSDLFRCRNFTQDKFRVLSNGTVFSTGGQKFNSVNFQAPAAGTYTLGTDYRSVSLDASISGGVNFTVILPFDVATAPGQIFDLWHLRAIISGVGSSNIITIKGQGTDTFFYNIGGTPTVAATFDLQNAAQRRAVKLISVYVDASNHFWMVLPYNV